jgi:hypothetical protein
MEEYILAGRIVGLRVMTVPEFGVRASFRLDCAGRYPVTCAVAGDVARELVAFYREGDTVAVKGIYETRPSTASSKTPWAGRFHVRALRVAELASVAACSFAATVVKLHSLPPGERASSVHFMEPLVLALANPASQEKPRLASRMATKSAMAAPPMLNVRRTSSST